MKKTKTQKGITLVALIITIIILLILAVVTISAVSGDGIIQHAKNASNSYNSAKEDEAVALQNYIDYIENNMRGGLDDTKVGYYGNSEYGIEFKADDKIVIYEYDKDSDTTTTTDGTYDDTTYTYKYTDKDKGEVTVTENYEFILIKGADGKTIVNKLIYIVDAGVLTANGSTGLPTTVNGLPTTGDKYEKDNEVDKFKFELIFNTESGTYEETYTDYYDSNTVYKDNYSGHYFVYDNYIWVDEGTPGCYWPHCQITESGLVVLEP